MAKVLVTGATGYLAGHCIAELLNHGYDVRGTVRNLQTADVAHLHPIAERTGGSLEFVEADLDRDAGWTTAVGGCDYIWHVASPFPSTAPKDPDEVIRPAVDGTLRVLRAAATSGTVKRVVMTSSGLAVHSGRQENRAFTEDDWGTLDDPFLYARSKTLAEKAAWEFAEQSGIELVAINPGSIIGPLQRAEAGNSVSIISRLMRAAMPAVPKIGWNVVDVRDLAHLHLLAMETPAAAGNRYIAGDEFMWGRDMAFALKDRYQTSGYRIPTRAMPYALMWAISRVEPGIRIGLTLWGHHDQVTSAKARNELGWTSRPAAESVLDTAESMIELGVVPRR
ncbi:aldehyde reductase [Actinoplanes sp. LDG1-06]|uniref:Aldehyde reductase n=1 Tax=Paractinoplanes ovalisporus TaxID=2810368 RepID=A0ABS2AWN6_9ACTN|nr:aldehyde reductase [Actinoplanes ovalisporus]MBM2623584.1 aldehyde reductase [Actinoplanes ovalisporus]